MNNINSVTLVGNLAHDIGEKDFGYVGDKAKLNVTIAVNKSVKENGEWVDKGMFFDLVMWGKTAENMKQYLCKGKGIAIEGRLDQDRWEKDGQKKSKIYITCNSVQLLAGGKQNENKDSANAQQDTSEDFKEDPVF